MRDNFPKSHTYSSGKNVEYSFWLHDVLFPRSGCASSGSANEILFVVTTSKEKEASIFSCRRHRPMGHEARSWLIPLYRVESQCHQDVVARTLITWSRGMARRTAGNRHGFVLYYLVGDSDQSQSIPLSFIGKLFLSDEGFAPI